MEIRSKAAFLGLICCLLSACSLVSCSVATPAKRIAANPALYSALPAKHQALVSKGQICEGMGENAVFLAWGRPNTPPYSGQQNGKLITRWQYESARPVFVNNDPWRYQHAMACPYHRHFADPYYGAPDVVYVPSTVATVVFVNGKVVSWERRGR